MEWQPIETAPKDGTPILAFGPCFPLAWDAEANVPFAVLRWGNGWEAFYTGTDPLDKPTHWIPLPKAPAPNP